MRKIEIEIPEGKEAQWDGDTLKFIDKRPIIERIKTFEDAVNELNNQDANNPLLLEYAAITAITNSCLKINCTKDLLAYLKLRIITAVLNEGWEPQFTEDEERWYPYYSAHSSSNYAHCEASSLYTDFSSRLYFKSRDLAEYAGQQFINLYKDFF